MLFAAIVIGTLRASNLSLYLNYFLQNRELNGRKKNFIGSIIIGFIIKKQMNVPSGYGDTEIFQTDMHSLRKLDSQRVNFT